MAQLLLLINQVYLRRPHSGGLKPNPAKHRIRIKRHNTARLYINVNNYAVMLR